MEKMPYADLEPWPEEVWNGEDEWLEWVASCGLNPDDLD